MINIFRKLEANLSLFIFIVFAIGVILSSYLSGKVLVSAFILFCLCLYFFAKNNKFLFSDIFLLLLFVLAGSFWFKPYAHSNLKDLTKIQREVVFKVTTLPRMSGQVKRCSILIKEIDRVPFSLKAKAADYSGKLDYLGVYRVKTKLTKREFYGRSVYFLWIKSDDQLQKLKVNLKDRLVKTVEAGLRGILFKNLKYSSYGFASSVFLGRRELFKEGSKIFRNAGVAHLLAISGTHVVIVTGILLFILRMFYVKYRLRLFICLIVLFLYAFICGANPPVIRASVMYAVFVASFFLKRKVSPFNSLGLAGLILLIFNPGWLFEAGFQLSFVSVFGLILGFHLFPLTNLKPKLLKYLVYLFFASFWVTLFITPLVSYFFGYVYILSLFYNLILIPFFSFIMMGLVTLVILSPFALMAQALGRTLDLSIESFTNICLFFGQIKGSFLVFSFEPGMILVYYILLVSFMMLVKNNIRRIYPCKSLLKCRIDSKGWF